MTHRTWSRESYFLVQEKVKLMTLTRVQQDYNITPTMCIVKNVFQLNFKVSVIFDKFNIS